MLNFICRIFLTINSTFLILIVYLFKLNHLEYIEITKHIKNILFLKNIIISQDFFIIILLIILIFLTKVLLWSLNLLDTDDLKNIKEIEQSNNSFLPTYLGYFFVALSINNLKTLFWIYSLIFVFTFISSLYFNPLFLLWGYNFYNITTKNDIKIFLITKKNIKNLEELSFKKLKRINNFTFIDMEVYDE